MNVGALRNRIVLENPGTPTDDNDGGFTQTWTELLPSPVSASIVPASSRELERVGAGTVISTATHIVTMRHHPDVTTETRITFGERLFHVIGVTNPDERNLQTVALAVEVVS